MSKDGDAQQLAGRGPAIDLLGLLPRGLAARVEVDAPGTLAREGGANGHVVAHEGHADAECPGGTGLGSRDHPILGPGVAITAKNVYLAVTALEAPSVHGGHVPTDHHRQPIQQPRGHG